MSGSHSGGSHHVPVVVEHADPFRQLRVSHEDHVADVGCGCEEKREDDLEKSRFIYETCSSYVSQKKVADPIC